MKITIPFQRQFNDNVRRKKIKTLRDAKKKNFQHQKEDLRRSTRNGSRCPKKERRRWTAQKKTPKKQTQHNKQKRNDATCINLATQSPHSVSFLRRRRVRVDDTKENGKNRKRDKKNEE